jgi:hypothetical protein
MVSSSRSPIARGDGIAQRPLYPAKELAEIRVAAKKQSRDRLAAAVQLIFNERR